MESNEQSNEQSSANFSVISREPYESCTVELSDNMKGELKVSVKLLNGGPSIDELDVVARAWAAYMKAKNGGR